jgi:hypothetical protein
VAVAAVVVVAVFLEEKEVHLALLVVAILLIHLGVVAAVLAVQDPLG